MACGASRIEGIVKGIDGVNAVSFNPSTSMLTVDYSSVAASVVDIQLELSVNGYDAGDFTRDTKAKLPPCANSGGAMRGDQAAEDSDEPGIDDIEGLDPDSDWENPDSFDVADKGDDLDIDLLEEEDDDSELTGWVGEGSDATDPVDSDDEDDDDDL